MGVILALYVRYCKCSAGLHARYWLGYFLDFSEVKRDFNQAKTPFSLLTA